MKKKLLAAVLCLTLGTVTVQGVFADTTVNVSSDLMNTTVSKENYEFENHKIMSDYCSP